jgi:hypothetical protein
MQIKLSKLQVDKASKYIFVEDLRKNRFDKTIIDKKFALMPTEMIHSEIQPDK